MKRSKRSHSASSDAEPGGSSKKKLKKHKEKHKKHKEKHKKSKEKKRSNRRHSADRTSEPQGATVELPPAASDAIQEASAVPAVKGPMTKEAWEQQQSVVRRVYDPETGRNRLIKGDGEVIEEIVSKKRHDEINKMATLGDGSYYAARMGLGTNTLR